MQYTRKEQLLAIVKAKAVSGATDLRWINARYQIADCLTMQEAQWRITAEQDMLDRSKREREIHNQHDLCWWLLAPPWIARIGPIAVHA